MSDDVPRIGYSDTQEQFVVPSTVDVVDQFLKPRNWTFPTVLILLGLFAQLGLTLLDVFPSWQIYLFDSVCIVLPKWVHIGSIVFWRLAYNAGLGFLLHVQSNYRSLTNMYASHVSRRTSLGRLLRYLAGAGHPNFEYVAIVFVARLQDDQLFWVCVCVVMEG
jgi:hypothetical protein